MMTTNKLIVAMLGLAAMTAPAAAKEYVIQMKNGSGPEMVSTEPVFDPPFVQAEVGDTVRFVPTNFGHNAAPIAGMVPAGLDLKPGAINKEYILKLTKPGFYGIECTPHYSMGMVALIKAGKGKAPNAAAAMKAKMPPLAAKRMKPLFAMAK